MSALSEIQARHVADHHLDIRLAVYDHEESPMDRLKQMYRDRAWLLTEVERLQAAEAVLVALRAYVQQAVEQLTLYDMDRHRRSYRAHVNVDAARRLLEAAIAPLSPAPPEAPL